ncbi:MAG: RodZ domain-containing protein [Pseudomonadota bacterium]
MTKITPLNADEKNGRRRIHLREISGDSDTPADTVGQELRAGRLRRGDDLATVSRDLKIRKDHLEAVEEDRLENLPGRTYAIGFVRSYAGYLGLDATEVVERYKQEISGRHDDHMQTVAPMPDEQRRLPQGWRFVAGIVVLAVGYGVWHLLSAGSAPQAVPPPPSLAPPKPAAVAPPPAPAAAEQTAIPSPAIENSAAADAPAPTPSTPPGTGAAAAAVTPQPSATPSPAQTSSAPAAPAQPEAAGSGTASAAPVVYGKSNNNPRVVLKARNDTHITVRGANGTVYINRNLKTGDTYQLPNAVGLTLSTTDAGAVELDLDGQAIGVAGGVQQSAENVSLDPQAIVDRFHR